jgi:hypothetical protein
MCAPEMLILPSPILLPWNVQETYQKLKAVLDYIVTNSYRAVLLLLLWEALH